jgi:uncharacterized protein (TIGR00730 family)
LESGLSSEVVVNITVFAGSSPGHRPEHARAAELTGRCIADAGMGLVYGGGSTGLMGVLADAALAVGGSVIGVIPEALTRAEIAHGGLTRQEVVPTMHARKARMAELADAFAVLPGGFGTLDEMFEIITWRQLGLHDKRVILIDVAGFWDTLLEFIGQQVTAGYVSEASRGLITTVPDPRDIAAAVMG